MKVGVIRCEEQSGRCAGYHCFPAIQNKTGKFQEYDTVELVGFDTCGGCGRGKADKIMAKALRLKERGAEVIHLGDCLIVYCPFKDVYQKAINEGLELPVVEKTHGPRH